VDDTGYVDQPGNEEIPDGLTQGSPGALEAVYRALHPGVVAYLRAHGADEPEDLAADCFVQLARALPRFEGDWSDLRALTFTIARHRAIDAGRKRRRRRTDPSAAAALVEASRSGDVEGEALAALGDAAATAMVGLLPEAQAEVLRLRVLADLSVAETARILGKRPGAVRALQLRGLRRLAALLGEGE